jgi:hypothetical protein
MVAKNLTCNAVMYIVDLFICLYTYTIVNMSICMIKYPKWLELLIESWLLLKLLDTNTLWLGFLLVLSHWPWCTHLLRTLFLQVPHFYSNHQHLIKNCKYLTIHTCGVFIYSAKTCLCGKMSPHIGHLATSSDVAGGHTLSFYNRQTIPFLHMARSASC